MDLLCNFSGHALSDQKSSKSVPRYKDHVNCGPEETKVDDQSECTIRVTCDLSNTINQDCLEDVNMSANAGIQFMSSSFTRHAMFTVIEMLKNEYCL